MHRTTEISRCVPLLLLLVSCPSDGQTHPDLEARSHAVAAVEEGAAMDRTDQWWWISDDELVIERDISHENKGQLVLETDFRRRNIRTGVDVPLTKLTQRYRETCTSTGVKPSPDGLHVLWGESRENWHVDNYHAMIDGSHFFKTKDAETPLSWTADSTSWIAITGGALSETGSGGKFRTLVTLKCCISSAVQAIDRAPFTVTLDGNY